MPYNSQITRTNADALMPEEAAEVINGMEEGSVFLRHMTRLPNMTRGTERQPVLDVLPTSYFVNGDTGLRQTTNLAWKNKFLNAVEICCICPVSLNVINDAGHPIWGMAMPKMRQSIVQTAELAIAVGTNAPAYPVWPEAIIAQAEKGGNAVSLAGGVGLFTDGSGTVYTNGAFSNLYQAIAGDGGAFQKVELDGYENTAIVGTPGLRGKLRGMVDTTGRPLLVSESSGVGQPQQFNICGVPANFASNGSLPLASALAVGGDFSQAVYAIREDINFRVAIDGVITDNTNAIIYNLTQQRMAAIIMWFRMAWQVPNPPTLLSPGNTVNASDTNVARSPFFKLVA